MLIYRSDWLNPTEGFVADHAAHLTRYAPVTLGLRAPIAALRSEPQFWACGKPRPSDLARYAFRAFGIGPRSLPPISLIHAHFATDALDMLPLARRLDVPLLVTLHGYDVGVARRPLWRGDGLHWRWKNKRLLRQARLFLPVSHWLAAQAEMVGFPADKLKVHHLGTMLPALRNGDRHGVAFVGRLVESKGLSDLIRALSLLTERGLTIPLTVVGDGPDRAHLEAFARARAVPTHFWGTLSPEAARRIMAEVKAIILPSRQEAFGLVLIEAQAAGTPVVAYDQTGTSEAVGPGGRLVPPGDLAGLATAIGELTTNDGTWRSASALARNHAAEHFDIAQRTAQLEALYDRVLAS